MFLRSLSLKGFKSFADTALLQMEPGVTVVVGPNGSGKSNVVDAIAWVLGAQAPSAVRSQKMDDVIFAGSAKRAALGRAEVALTIDNSAGVLPIEFSEVTITRRLWRTGETEYAINSAPCRLLDIQELLSDSGVGRTQHVIISQGQIDAVLNAKPEDRRLIIEEAAGILKYRRRKERSERRLNATEANLTRLQDLLREVRRQLRPLERQADDARRHGSVVAELQALKLHLAGRQFQRLRTTLAESAATQDRIRTRSQGLRAALGDLDARILATEAALGAAGGSDVSEALGRHEALRERAKGLDNLLAERCRGVERELAVAIDEGVIAALESEHAQLTAEAAEVEAEAAGLVEIEARWRSGEQALADARRDHQQRWGDEPELATPSGAAAEVRGELAALSAAADRTASDRRRLDGQHTQLVARQQRLAADVERFAAQVQSATEGAPGLAETAEVARADRSRAEESLTAADEAARDAAAARSRWSARADALAQALDAARRRAGAERLSSLDGVLGTLLDLVDVDPGWEAAFEAAAGEALSAVVVDGVGVGRRAVEVLASKRIAGAVLPLGEGGTPVRTPPVGEAVRSHVRSVRPGVDGLLDALLGGVVAVDGGWTAAVDAMVAHPGLVVVTREGDRFAPAGWRVGGAHGEATGAALEEARAQAEQAAGVDAAARESLARARAELDRARAAETQAVRAAEECERAVANGREQLRRADQGREEVERELAALEQHRADVEARAGREAERAGELAARLPELEAAEAEASEQVRRLTEERRALEVQAAEVGGLRSDLEIRSAGIVERRRFLAGRLEQVSERLSRNTAEAAAAAQRRVELLARAEVTSHLVTYVRGHLQWIDGEVSRLREERRRQSDEVRRVSGLLDGLRSERVAAEKELGELRELQHRSEVADAETRLRLENLTAAVRSELDAEPDTAMAADCPELPAGVAPSERVRHLERDLKSMGPINPLALQEFAELSERHEFLQGQLDDVRSSRRELSKVIRAVDGEIVKVFEAAYADVAVNFEQLFETLFPGGRGRLRLTDPEDLLNTGVEVEAKPSGKNVKKLSLLSGGERSLVALAYLFAVFRSRPSPFYVMDEVEAALDDVNLHRFLALVSEFRSSAQLIIVSHQKRTMEAADVLYGVTMEPGGSSKVVAERVNI